MTIEEFETAAFGKDTKILFKGIEHNLLAVDFDAQLLEITTENPKFYITDYDRISAFVSDCEIVKPK